MNRNALLAALFLGMFSPDVAEGQYGRFTDWFGVNKVQWNVADCNWQVLKSSHANVYYCEGGKAIAQVGIAYTESSYDTLKTLFGVEPQSRRRIITYLPGHVQETNTWPGIVPGAVAAWYEDEGGFERTVLPFTGDYHWLRCVERHEMTHNFQGAIVRRFLPDEDLTSLHKMYGVPLWWTEGQAEYRAGGHGTCRGIDRDILLRDMVLSNALPTFARLAESPWGFAHYLVGFEAHRYLGEELGDSLATLLWQNLGVLRDSLSGNPGNVFEAAFKKTYGMSLDEFSVRFKHHLRVLYLPRYDGTELPIELTAKPLEIGIKYAAPVSLYKHEDKTNLILYSAYDGHPTLYRLTLPLTDSAEVADSVEIADSVQVLIRGGRRGYESIDPWVDVYGDSLLVLAAKDKASYVLVIWDISNNREVLRRRFENIQIISSPTWDPEGKRIVFSGSFYSSESDSSGVFDLYMYYRETDTLERITHDVYFDGAPEWQPNGKWIVFESDRAEGGDQGYQNLFLLDSETLEIRYLTNGSWHDYYASWAPDGESVVFTSDRDGSYDLYQVNVEGVGKRLTKYWGSAFFGHVLPNDSTLLFSGLYEGERKIYIQELFKGRSDSLERITLDISDSGWRLAWRWEGRESRWYRDVTEESYKSEYRLEGFCGGALLAGYGYATSCGAMIPDFFDDQWFFASVGISNFSWVPGRGRFNASAGFADIGKRLDYAAFLYFADNPAIDIPIRHAFEETSAGGGGVLFYPFSKFFRLESTIGVEYVNQRDLYDWTNPFDLNHSVDTIRFKTRGFRTTLGVTLVGDNALGISTGPVVGYRYRIGAIVTTNLSSLVRMENDLPDLLSLGPDPEEQIDTEILTNYILHVDLRQYVRLGLISTLGLRFYGYYSGGEIPTYLSFGKRNGMAAFYPWNSPYGSRGWMMNSRVTVPFVNFLFMNVPILEKISLSGIRGEIFFDLAQTWFRNGERGPIYGDRGIGLRIPFPIGTMRLDWGKMFVWPLGSGYELPEWYRKKSFGIGFGYDF